MKRLLLILILTLSFQSWSKADDIRDFEIEGMSIGDSLLDHFDEGDNYIELINTYHENEINKKIEGVRNNYKAENV